MRTRHPSNTNNPDQEAARVFEATLKLHVAAHPACQWELDWFRACLKKVRRSRRLIDDQLAHAPRPLCDAFMRELALGDRSPSPSPAADRRSSALLTHLPEEHDVAPSDLDTSLDSIADLARPRPGSLSPQISPRATIPGTPYDEPPSATSSIAPTPKVPGAFFASVQSLVPSNGASPAIHPHAMEPGPSPEPLPNPQPDQRPQTNVPEIFIAPDEPTPRFERPSPFDHPEIPRVHSVSPHTSFPGDVPNQDACPIYSTSAGDVPNARTDDDRRPNPLRLPGAYAPSETSLTPSQSVEDLTTPVDNKTPTETPITPGLELDLFPKPPSTGLAPVVTVPSVNVISGPSALSPISPKVPGAYAPSIFDATPAMSPVPLEPMSPHPAFEDDSPNSASESVTDTLVDDESTTPVQETLPIPRGVSYNPILAGQTTNRASRSFPIDETALEGQTPTTEPSTPFVLIPSPERLDVGHRPSPPGVDTPVSDLTTDSWEDVSPSNDSGSPSDALESRQDKAPGNEVEEPAEPDTEISPASVPVVDAAKQAQDEALPVQDDENAPEPVPAGKPAADVPDEQTHVSPAPVDSEAAPEPEQLSSEPKVEQPTSEPVHEAPSPLPTETIDRPVSNVVLAVSESGPASEVEPHPAPPVDATIGATPPGVVHEDTLTRVSDSGPRPELESATLVRTEVVQAGETPVPEAEPTREPENDQAKQEVHPVSREADQPAVEQASAEEPEPRTKDVPEAPVVQPAVLVQEAVEADSQVEKLEQPAEPTDVHVAPEPEQPALELQQEALPEGPATLATEPEIPSVPSLEPLEAPVTVGRNKADAQPSLPLGPEEHAVTHEESVLPKEPAVEHPAIVPPAQEAQKEQTENELEQAPQAAEIDARDAPLTQPVEAKLPIVAALASVDSISPKPVSSDQPAEPATLAHITSNTVSSQPEQSIDEPATPEHAPTLSAPPAAPTGVADMETSEVVRVVEQPETIASGLDSVHQPAVPDIQLLISEPPKLGASEATSVGPEVESADESESAADSESVHTPPATVADTSLNPTARAKELSQEANKLSEKFAAYGDVDDLDDAIELYGRAAELLAPGSEVLDVSSYLNLGRMMRVKFEAFNDIPDLEAAINDSLLKAYDILKSDPAHESYCDVLYELGAASLDRYLYDASKTAGDDALDYCQKALNASASPAGPKYADIRSVMSRLHLARFEYLSDAEDAEKALEHLDAAASAHVAIEREPKYTENRARVLFACYQTGRQEYDDRLEQALSLAQEAVNRTLEGSIHYPIASTFLAEVLLARYERFSDRADLDAAHRYLEEAVQEVPYVSPDQPWVGERLARALIAKFVNDGNSEDLDDAIAFLEIALNLTVANPYRRQPRLDAFGRALTLRFRHRALGESTTGDGLRELMAGGDSL